MKIFISKPFVNFKDLDYASRAAVYSWGDQKNYYAKKFENILKQFVKKKYCILTSSCTGATHIALSALNLKKGDEVILPNLTWFSCASVIKYFNAKPVFVDVDPNTLCINTKKIEEKITKKTKAILAVHLYGSVANLDDLVKIKKKYKLTLLEDCAEALGSKFDNKNVGNIGDISLFSFHGSKTISTCGEGGALLTNNSNFFKKALKISDHGKSSKKIFFQDILGLKYKMTDVQAAMGVSQFLKLKKINDKKKIIYNKYLLELNDLPLKFITSTKKSNPSFWMPTFIVKNKKFNQMKFMKFVMD